MKAMIILLVSLTCFAGYIQGQSKTETDSFTSISFTASNGKHYKLISAGDMVPQLFINGLELSRREMEEHAVILNQLLKDLHMRQQKELSEINTQQEEQIKKLVNQLVADGIVASPESLTSLVLDKSSFIVNGKKQSWAALERYQQLFPNFALNYYHFNAK
jgi:hypothetical protein